MRQGEWLWFLCQLSQNLQWEMKGSRNYSWGAPVPQQRPSCGGDAVLQKRTDIQGTNKLTGGPSKKRPASHLIPSVPGSLCTQAFVTFLPSRSPPASSAEGHLCPHASLGRPQLEEGPGPSLGAGRALRALELGDCCPGRSGASALALPRTSLSSWGASKTGTYLF